MIFSRYECVICHGFICVDKTIHSVHTVNAHLQSLISAKSNKRPSKPNSHVCDYATDCWNIIDPNPNAFSWKDLSGLKFCLIRSSIKRNWTKNNSNWSNPSVGCTELWDKPAYEFASNWTEIEPMFETYKICLSLKRPFVGSTQFHLHTWYICVRNMSIKSITYFYRRI